MSKTTTNQFGKFLQLDDEELKKFYQKCKRYNHKIISQQKKRGNEFVTNKQLREFLKSDPDTPDWLPNYPKSKFDRMEKFSMIDYTGIKDKNRPNRSKEEYEKIYKKCQKYVKSLIKKNPSIDTERKHYEFTRDDPNTPYWYQSRIFIRLGRSFEDFTGIGGYQSKNRKWISQEELAKEIQKIIRKRKMKIEVSKRGKIRVRDMFVKIKNFPEYKKDWPKSPKDIYGEQFKGNSFLILGMTDDELKFRYPMDECIKLAQIISRENGIRNLDEWVDVMLACGPIYGLPVSVRSGFRRFGENGKLIKESIRYPDAHEWLGLRGPWQYERDYAKALLISVPFCKKNKILTGTDWDRFFEKHPDEIPKEFSKFPDKFFRDLWEREKETRFTFSWGQWTGSGILSTNEKMKNYLPFKEAEPLYHQLAKEHGLTNGADFERLAKTHKKLLDELRLPAEPSRVYSKERVWKVEYEKKV